MYLDSRLTHRDPQLLQLAVDPRRSPERIRGGHLANEGADVVGHGRATALLALPGSEQAKTAPVPAEHGLRLDDVHGRAPAAPCLREPRPEQAVNLRETKAWSVRSVQDGELVSERNDFQVQ